MQFETRTPSKIRAVAWPTPEKIYLLLENQQLKVIDGETAAIIDSFDNMSSCFAVADDGTILAGSLRGGFQFIEGSKQTPIVEAMPAARSVCFLGSGGNYAAALADGSLLLHSDGQNRRVASPSPSAGDYDAWIFDDPANEMIMASQTTESDSLGFVKTFLRYISYEGRVEQTREVRLADVRAVSGSKRGPVYYDQSGLIEFATGKIIHNAAGFPVVAMVSTKESQPRIIGLRSDNSLSNQMVI